MKTDVLTIAAIIFLVGVLVSSLGITEGFDAESESAPQAELQQGVSERNE